MASNLILPFAQGAGANVLSDAGWAASDVLAQGFQSGRAASIKYNKALLQSTSVASGFGQFVADYSAQDFSDGLSPQAMRDNFRIALAAAQAAAYYAADTSSAANTITLTLNPAPPTLNSFISIFFKVANANTGPAMLYLNGFSGKPLNRRDNTPLQANDLQAGVVAHAYYDAANNAFRMVGSVASDGTVTASTVKTLAFARTQLFSSRVAGTYTVTVPAGVTRIFIPGIWGGGGGAGYNSNGGAPSGGGSGAFNCDPAGAGYAVTPGDVLTIVIGAGGTGGSQSPAQQGQPGGDTYIKQNNTELMRAGGGGGGLNGATSGGIANSPVGGTPTGGDANRRQYGTPGAYGQANPTNGAIVGGDGAGAPGPGGGTYVRGGQGSPAAGSAPGGGGAATINNTFGGAVGAPGGADIFY